MQGEDWQPQTKIVLWRYCSKRRGWSQISWIRRGKSFSLDARNALRAKEKKKKKKKGSENKRKEIACKRNLIPSVVGVARKRNFSSVYRCYVEEIEKGSQLLFPLECFSLLFLPFFFCFFSFGKLGFVEGSVKFLWKRFHWAHTWNFCG